MSLETYQTPPEGSTWQQGRNKCTLSFPGFAADFEVTVTESPIREITARAAHDLVDWFDDTAPKAEESAPADPEQQPIKKAGHFGVDQNEVVIKAELKDGTVLEGTPERIRRQLLERFDPKNNDLHDAVEKKYQISYEENTSDWQLGSHRCSIHFMGYDLPFEVTLVENPVASVEAVFRKKLTEGIDGRMESGKDDSKQMYYNVDKYEDLTLTVRLKDGTVYSGTGREVNKLMRESYGNMPLFEVETWQDEDHVWTVGENRCTLRAFGKETDFNVTLVPCPVADVTAKQIRPVYKGLDGEDYGSGYFRHDYKDALQLTLTFTDGREPVSGTLAELEEKTGYRFNSSSPQEVWEWQKLDEMKVIVLCGREYTFTVTLSDAPEGVYGPGDVDGDGAVTSADARLALRASVQLERFKNGSGKAVAADVNHDGVIGSDDARLILRASVKLETLPLPEPAPANAQ